MRIERTARGFIIVRGSGPREQFFAFFVDSTGSSWTNRIADARLYQTIDRAEREWGELKKRMRMRARHPVPDKPAAETRGK
jgi:hypothetical protein